MPDELEWKWNPRHYPELPNRIQRLEGTMQTVENRLEEGARVMARIHWLGWLVAAELAFLAAQNFFN